MRRTRALAVAALWGLATFPALAGDLPLKAPAAPPATSVDWSGFYFGGHLGYGAGEARTTTFDPTATIAQSNTDSPIAGAQLGYNRAFSSGLLLGVESDVTFFNYFEMSPVLARVPTPAGNVVTNQMDLVGTLRGRVGQTFGPLMVYGTGGLAYAAGRVTNDLASGDSEKALYGRTGWVAGGGVEYAFAPQWTAGLEYLFYDFGSVDVTLRSGARQLSSFDYGTLSIVLNRRLDWPGAGPAKAAPSDEPLGGDRWELHAQSTYVQQGNAPFHAAYGAANSLAPWATTRETWTGSAFIAMRLWDGGEFYASPELFQGAGLGETLGLAGFPNGEASTTPYPYPRLTPSRWFVRQVFGFGGEEEKFESAQQQLSGKYDISRLTIQAGKFPVVDIFDGNAYAKDPRKDFMNWSIWAPGALDVPADKVGITAEFNQKDWALRAGYFLIGTESYSDDMDMHIGERGSYIVEFEERYSLFSQPGKVRVLGFLNSANAGSYRATLDDPALALDLTQTRQGRIKYGFSGNFEQALSDDIGLFGRLSWNNGKTEVMAFTDIDASVSFGTAIKGTPWGRKDDTIGVAAAINGLSQDHRDFLAAGGMGVLIGDGALNYATEQIIETFYSIGLFTGTALTFDYQHVANPAYNADRGPVSIFSVRLHGEL